VPYERSEVGWSGHLYGVCPVLGEGIWGEYGWFFRARDSKWTVWIAAKPWSWESWLKHGWKREGTSAKTAEAASWMPLSVAWGLVEASVGEFLNSGAKLSTDRWPA